MIDDRLDASRSILTSHGHQSSGKEGSPLQHLPSTWFASPCVYNSLLPCISHFQGYHSKNESEGARGLATEVPLVVATTDRSLDPVLVQNPVLRAGKPPLQS
jgi:hypothetical protein